MNMVYGHPIWYKPNYRKYGLRRLQINSKYIYEEEYPDRGETGINTPGRNCYIDGEDEAGERQINAGAGDDGDVSQKTIDLFNWNIKNNAMENGSILLKGDVKYKIGTRLYIKSEDMEYYIENVSHTFIYNEDWKTTVEVTRGIKPSKRFTKPWNQWAKLTALDMEEIMGIDISYAQNKAQAPGKPGKPGAPNTPGASEESILGKIGKWAKRKANGATMVNPTGDATAAISSPFGNRQHPISGQWKQHNGLDIPGANGSPMYAAQDGTVSFVGYDSGGYGNYIIIDHGGGMTTLYGHAHSLSAKEGQKVSAGEQIGKIGSTGGSTGPHIHFEVKQDGTPIDPYPFLYGKR
ncbi:MAG: M23 family metallopeptidase [Tissierellia bacterium]|nr:M23 family metallopeptidase [Tissierellia bacterium]